MIANKNRERMLSRALNKAGYKLQSSKVRNVNIDNLGGYRIVNIYYNFAVAGSRFELDLDDVSDWVDYLLQE